MRRRSLLALLAASTGCSIPGDLSLDVGPIPPGVGLVAVLGLDGDGAVRGATGLVPVREGRAIAFGELPDAEGYEVLGYAEGAFAALPEEAALRAAPLRVALGDEARMPASAFGVRLDADGARLPSPPAARALTAAWLPPCPSYDDPTHGVALSCAFRDCAPAIFQSGCRFTLDAQSCLRGTLETEVLPSGRLRFAPTEALGQCEQREPPPGVALALECSGGIAESCRIEVHTATTPPAYDVDVITLAPPLAPELQLPIARPPVGYLTGLAFAEGRVLVARNRDRIWAWEECPPERAGVVDLVDAETLEVETATAVPPCIVGLAEDPRGRGALFLTGGTAPTVGVIDAYGRVAHHRPLGVELPPEERPNRLYTFGERVFALSRLRPLVEGVDASASIVELDPDSLEPRPRLAVPESVEVMAQGLDGAIHVVGNYRDDLYTLSPSRTLVDKVDLWALCSHGFGIKPNALAAHAASRRLFVAATESDSPSGFLLDGDVSCAPVAFPWGNADSFGAVEDPRDPSRLLVALGVLRGVRHGPGGWINVGEMRAVLARLDVAGARYVGAPLELGVGTPDAIVRDARGVIWLTLPWDGKLVRVR